MSMVQKRWYTKFKTFINPKPSLLNEYIVSKLNHQSGSNISPHLRYNVFKSSKDKNTGEDKLKYGYRSMIIISTPSQIKATVLQTYKLSLEFPNLQIITVCIDSILRFRNGISIGLFDKPMTIHKFSELKDHESDNEISEFSFFVKPDENDIDNNLKVFKCGLANTIFEYGKLNVLYFFNFYNDLTKMETFKERVKGKEQEQESGLNGVKKLHIQRSTTDSANGLMLRNLHVELPKSDFFQTIDFEVPLKLLEFEKFDPVSGDDLKITDVKGNLIKTINEKPASKYLENNEIVLNADEAEIYIEVISSSSTSPNHNDIPRIFKVTTGGGGWGKKGSYIAIDTKYRNKVPGEPMKDFELVKGMKVRFYISDGSELSDKFEDLEDMKGDGRSKLILGVCEAQSKYTTTEVDDNPGDNQLLIEVDNVLGITPESDIQVNTTRYKCRGARLTATPATL